MKQIIEIKGECELIQIDLFQLSEDKQRWKSGETINCNIYFQKNECKFASKDIVISYNALKISMID